MAKSSISNGSPLFWLHRLVIFYKLCQKQIIANDSKKDFFAKKLNSLILQ